MKRLLQLIFFFLFLVATSVTGQDIKHYNNFNFRVNEGMLQSTIRDIAFDLNNFGWISYPNGIQRFDGIRFTSVPIQPGLPDDKWAYFQQLPSGDLLISHIYGVSLYHVSNNSFRMVIRWAKPLTDPFSFLGYDDGMIYLFGEKNEVLGFNRDFKLVIRKCITPGDPLGEKVIFSNRNSFVDHCFIGSYQNRLYKWRLRDLGVESVSINLGDHYLYYLNIDKQGNGIYLTQHADSINIFKYDFGLQQPRFLFSLKQRWIPTLRINLYYWKEKLLLGFEDRVFELDSITLKPRLELTNINGEPFINGASIGKFTTDRYGNLFIQTVMNGISKVVNNILPIKYYGNYYQANNFSISVFPDKAANRVLVGILGSGLFIYDTSQHLIKKWHRIPGLSQNLSPNQIVKSPDGGYYFFSYTIPFLFYLDPDLNSIKPIKIREENGEQFTRYPSYYANPLYQDKNIAISQLENYIFTINFHQKSVIVRRLSGGAIPSGLYRSPFFIFHRNDSLLFINPADLRVIKSAYLPNTGGVRCYLSDGDSSFLMGTNKGIFRVNDRGVLLYHWDKNLGLPDECIYSMQRDITGGIWCSSNRGIFRVGKDKSILQITQDEGLQDNEFNTQSTFKCADGEMFFGGVNGLNSFYPSSILLRKDSLRILFTDIRINNQSFTGEVLTKVNKLELPFNKNALSFDFLAMSAGNPTQFVYQYRMIGFDEDWIKNTGTQTVRYFLTPGKYKFQVYASRAFDANAIPQKEIDIIISPPFWQTWWFALLLLVLLLLVVGFIFRIIYRGRYEKQMLRLQSEKEIQMERERISRDLHDSIGAYANTVLYKTQVLEDQEIGRKELLDDLKYASKDIITALRETIWALKNENFMASDCLIRIRNFVQSLNKYYSSIHFTVLGDAPPQKMVLSANALNLVRIVQEAITNAIKHAKCKNIVVNSSYNNQYWIIRIEDDGIGFNQEDANKDEEGNGLKHMADRAKEGDLAFQLLSQPGRGTTVELKLKL